MAQRQQQPLILTFLILTSACGVALTHFLGDITSPILFLIKACLSLFSVVLLLTCLILTLILRKKAITLSTIAAFAIQTPFLLPSFDPATYVMASAEKAEKMVVATFSTMTRTDNVDDIVKFIEQEKPDILCLQELAPEHQKRLSNRIQKIYHDSWYGLANQVILSKFPIEKLKDTGHMQIGRVIHPAFGSVTLINTHMPRPYLGKNKPWNILYRQLNETPEQQERPPEKLILFGDLNTTPNNSIYQILLYRYRLSDSLTSGYGLTYPNAQRRSSLFGPLLRIDYILTRGFRAQQTRTINASKLSDHRAVMTTLTSDEKYE